jgi:hypothetical protein
VVSASGFITEDQMCGHHSMKDLLMCIVGTILGCEHCARLCRDARSGTVMCVHLNDVRMKDVSKNSCYFLRKIYYCPYSKIVVQ